MVKAEQYLEWLDLRGGNVDEWGEKLCYCGHTSHCDCGNPDLETFRESVERGTIILNDKNNGWKQEE